MAYISGIPIDELDPTITPIIPAPLGIIVLGSASDGVLGDVRYFTDVDTARSAYGGLAVARLTPAPTDIIATLPVGFSPDDPSLSYGSTEVYNFPSNLLNQAVEYVGLGNYLGSNSYPVEISFDAIGYDPSVQPGAGEIFIQSPQTFNSSERSSLVNHQSTCSGSLLFPLISILNETNGALAVGAWRVGETWLPSLPSRIDIYPTNSSSGTVFTLRTIDTGDKTVSDKSLFTYVSVSSGGITIDPGYYGLPYVRKTYNFSDYTAWLPLLSAIQIDGLLGYIPFNLETYTIPTGSYGNYQTPTGTVVYSPYYDTYGTVAQDLTTAAGWARVLNQEVPDFTNFGFVVLAGLDGKALARDPVSAASILNALTYDNNTVGTSYGIGPTLVLPWSIKPPPSGEVYTSSGDVLLANTLLSSLGIILSQRLLLIFGTGYQTGMPDAVPNTPTPVPAAYMAIAASLTDWITNTGSPSRPEIETFYSGLAPWFSESLAEPPLGVYSHSTPSPKDIVALKGAGIIPVIKAPGNFWTLSTPTETLGGYSLLSIMTVAYIRYMVENTLNPFIGQPSVATVRGQIQNTLTNLASSLVSSTDVSSSQIASLNLMLQLGTTTTGVSLETLNVTGNLALYNELETIQFQVSYSNTTV